MEFGAFFMLLASTAVMTYWTFGIERDRTMLFPDYYFFSERRLVNHTIRTKHVKNFDDCELLCYLHDNCVSANFKKYPENGGIAYVCELNNATHLEHEMDLVTDNVFYYRGSKNACGKNSPCQNNAACQSGFTFKGYRCSCPVGFEGEYCENDIDECKTNSHNCNANALCNNTIGSYHCSCKPGYIGNGRNCTVDPCQLHTVLNDVDRDIENVEEGEKCDSELETGWYRFRDIPGIRMPTECPPTDTRCGTSWPGWLKGDHPTVDDGIVTRIVKFRRRNNCEEQTLFDIKVKNCSSFFVYLLRSTVGCTYRFCYRQQQQQN